MSSDDFDFNQLQPITTKGKKKAKTLSKVRVDKSKNKYVEMAIPPPDTDLYKIQPFDYIIKKIDLGKKNTSGYR